MPANLQSGIKVRLRNGAIRGPLRDRSSENERWPWGEACACCGQPSLNEMNWKPDGGYGRMDPEQPNVCLDYDDPGPFLEDIIAVNL